jgi:hypothetical protein
MPDARDVLTDSEMFALRDVLTHAPAVDDWDSVRSAITKIPEHGLAPEAQRRGRSDAREATAAISAATDGYWRTECHPRYLLAGWSMRAVHVGAGSGLRAFAMALRRWRFGLQRSGLAK